MTKYIPENLNINNLLKKRRPYKTIKKFNKNFLFYLIGLIYEIQAEIKNLYKTNKDNDGSVPLYSKALSNINSNYKQYINFLIKNGVFEKTKNYSTIYKSSIRYRFTEAYRDQNIKSVEITDSKFTNKVYQCFQKHYLNSNTLNDKFQPKDIKSIFYDELELFRNQEKWLNNLTVDSKVDEKINQETDIKKRNIQFIRISRIKNNENKFIHRDKNVYRCHSLLTNLNRDLRPFLQLNGKILGQIDIKNSQPFFSLLLFNKSFWINENGIIKAYFNSSKTTVESQQKRKKKYVEINEIINAIEKIDNSELVKYKNLVLSGTLYDHIKDLANTTYRDKFTEPITRDDAKELIFTIFFSSNRYNIFSFDLDPITDETIVTKFPKNVFSDNFPTIFKFFSLIKRHNKPRMAIILQRIESYVVIDKIYKRIFREIPDVPAMTIHDSVVSTVDNLDLIKGIMEEEIVNYTHNFPTLKKEIWKIE